MNAASVRRNPASVIVILFVLFFACTKIVTTNIGGDLIPPVDGVTTKDTNLNVITKNFGDSTVRVTISDLNSLGFIDDPLFGKTNAAINVQIKPARFPFYFEAAKDKLSLDSVVLVLGYNSAWGDTVPPLQLRVNEISSDANFTVDSLYLNTRFFDKQAEVTEFGMPRTVFINKLKDSVHPFNEDAANQLRIRLSADFGNKLLKEFDTSAFNGAYKNDSLFNRYFRGLQVVPEEAGNAFMKINLLDTNTKIALYYRYLDTANKEDTAVKYFKTNNFSCASSNYIKRQRSSGQIINYIPPNSNLSLTDSLIFIDAAPGAFAKIQIPGLDGFPNMIIHRAELLIEQAPDEVNPTDKYLTPPNLFLAAYSNDSSRRFAVPNDIQFSSGQILNLSSFGCYPIKHTNSAGQTTYSYNFDLSRYLQGIVTRKEKAYDFFLYAPYNDYIGFSETSFITVPITIPPLNSPAIGRIRLEGGSNQPLSARPHKMRFHIVYSLL